MAPLSKGQPRGPRERVERGRTPGVSDKEGHGGAEGVWTPPPAGPGSGQSGDRGSWANTALDKAISRRKAAHLSRDSLSVTTRFVFYLFFMDAWTVV